MLLPAKNSQVVFSGVLVVLNRILPRTIYLLFENMLYMIDAVVKFFFEFVDFPFQDYLKTDSNSANLE